MKIKQLHLQNYGRFEDLTVDFAANGERSGNVTVIVGNNGAGKSQILQALATGLSWFVSGLRNESDGFEVDKKFIKNGKNDGLVELNVDFGDYNYPNLGTIFNAEDKSTTWQIINVLDGKNSKFTSSLNGLKKVNSNYRKAFTENDQLSLPLIIFYPVERSKGVRNISFSLLNNNDYKQVDAYQDSLSENISFKEFFEWFKQREDIENEIKSLDLKNDKFDVSKALIDFASEYTNLYEAIVNPAEKNQQDIQDRYRNHMLELEKLQQALEEKSARIDSKIDTVLGFAREAIVKFTGFSNLYIQRQGTPTMIVEKDGLELDVNQLSQGEKSLLALVGDIARRLAILNPSLDDPLQGEGVVMIDEVDLHLHPKWQHNLIDKLVKTFPKVQFILTTHSPLIVSDKKDILVYVLDNGELQTVGNIYGEDANTVLTKVFDTDYRDSDVQQQFNQIYQLISEKNFSQAEQAIIDLEEELPTHNLELLRLRLHLTQAQLAET